MRDGVIYPVDWESAAVGPGEIDLASLTEEWPAETVRRCRARYVADRWPEGEPADFDRTLKAAQMYLHFRWLGNRAQWTQAPRQRGTFERIKVLATELGVI